MTRRKFRTERGELRERNREGNYLLIGCVSHPSSQVVGACLFLGE